MKCVLLQGVPSLPELKLRYYELLIRYYSHYSNYLEMTRCYRAIYETESVVADMDKWGQASRGVEAKDWRSIIRGRWGDVARDRPPSPPFPSSLLSLGLISLKVDPPSTTCRRC